MCISFYTISNANKKLDKQHFKDNMGILGLDTAFLLSERVFDLMDGDNDGQVFALNKIYMTIFRSVFKSLFFIWTS